MIPIRIAFLTTATLLSLGAGYLGYMGIGGESTDLDRSIRVGSSGNSFANSNVK